MKWFKHLSGSLNNSDIFDSIRLFGAEGYLVFFGTLELMADEFDPKNPGISRISVRKMMKNLQISDKKLTKILNFFSEKRRIITERDGDYFNLNCPRLAELSDEYTSRKKKEISGVCPDTYRELLQPIEEEVEVEEEKDKTIMDDAEGDQDGKKKKPPLPTIVYEDEKFKIIPDRFLKKWKEVAPGIDVWVEIRKAELWLISNPDKKRSKWSSFLSNWMIRAQENYIKYGGNNGKRSGTYRTDIRGHAVQDEAERINAEWRAGKAAKEAARRSAGGVAGDDDAPDFPSNRP